MKKTLVMLLAVAASLIGLTACNTVQGIGKDVQKAGQAVENVGKK